MLKFRAILVAICASLLSVAAVADTRNVVTDFGATPNNGSDDDASAFRDAVTWAAGVGGGTIYVPNGAYHFTSLDPASPSPILAHVIVSTSNIRFVGDTPTYFGDGGTRIVSLSQGSTCFYVNAPNLMVGGSPIMSFMMENININRFHAGTGYGILFDGTVTAYDSSSTNRIQGAVLRNVHATNHWRGISTREYANNSNVRIESLLIDGCTVRQNGEDGVYINEFSNLKVIASEFTNNGGNGLRLRSYLTTSGGAAISASFMKSNAGAGLSVRGETTYAASNLAKDVLVTGCLMSQNTGNGFTITQASNIQIATCTVSENQGGSGANIGAATGVAISGSTFRGNYGRGLQLSLASGVTVASCSFVGNNASNINVYAIEILAGSTHSYSNLSLRVQPAAVLKSWASLFPATIIRHLTQPVS